MFSIETLRKGDIIHARDFACEGDFRVSEVTGSRVYATGIKYKIHPGKRLSKTFVYPEKTEGEHETYFLGSEVERIVSRADESAPAGNTYEMSLKLSERLDAMLAASSEAIQFAPLSWKFPDLGFIEKVSKTMDKFKLFLTKEPFKTYRKAGITNGDNILTDDGVKIFLTYLLEKNPEFIDVAKELVDEKK